MQLSILSESDSQDILNYKSIGQHIPVDIIDYSFTIMLSICNKRRRQCSCIRKMKANLENRLFC